MAAELRIVEEKTEGVKARTVLWYMTFFGFAVNYIIRINASIALVDMIDMNYKKGGGNKTIVVSECIIADENLTLNSSISDGSLFAPPAEETAKYVSLERRFLDYLGVEYERDGFKWDEHTQSAVLGSFYWLNWVTQLPGGILAAKYGTKVVFGVSNFIACVLCFFTPIACYIDHRLMIFIRLVSGCVAGVAWPAMHHLVGIWIPGNERSRFVTAYLGSSVGVAVCYPIFGFIMKATSWEWVFHFCFVAGTIWFILWQYNVYDSPEEHPRIHPSERGYILQVLGSSVIRDQKKRVIPWRQIMTSRCIWVQCVTQLGGIWGLFTLLTQSPTYFRIIHGWSIEMTGILSGIPHLMRTLFSLAFSTFGDYLLTHDKMSRGNVRKLATFFHLVLNGIFCFGLAYAGCDITQAVVFLTISLSLHGAVSTGVLASMIDNSPNYSGIVMGISSTIGIISGFVSPIIVGYMTFENQTVEAWQHIFELCAVIMIVCGIVYILFNDASLQPWNKPPVDTFKSKEMKEMIDNNNRITVDDYEVKRVKGVNC